MNRLGGGIVAGRTGYSIIVDRTSEAVFALRQQEIQISSQSAHCDSGR